MYVWEYVIKKEKIENTLIDICIIINIFDKRFVKQCSQ
jgi:hypothetical protein